MTRIKSYSKFINNLSRQRQPSFIRQITAKLAAGPRDVIPLSGGLPNPGMFPFKSADLTLTDGSSFKLEGDTMKFALQYCPTNGVPDLVQRLKTFQTLVHGMKDEDVWQKYDLVVTNGSQDGLSKALEMILTPGQPVLVEEYVYSGTLAIMNPYDPKYLQVESDEDGMVPESLQNILLEIKESNGIMPKLLYINPIGANPTGKNLSTERKEEIYKICSDFDILIFEDDPYYFLQFGDCRERVRSFLSMDVDGRVLRFDSFSKILSSGIRIGFLTAPQPLAERVVLHMQSSLIHASSMSQVLTNELFNAWGHEGFLSHVEKVEDFYRQRRDCMTEAAEKHLGHLCEWTEPKAGMFFWMKVQEIEDTWNMIMSKAVKKKFMVLPGRPFSTNINAPCPYIRAAFSLASPQNIDTAFERLAVLIKEEIRGMQKKN